MRPTSITIVTPCWNAATLIERTVESVLNQTAVRSGRLRLQYVICDGGSTDGTLESITRLCGDCATVISERDTGMYDALAKGLRRASGDIVAYLNAGDEYFPTAFDVIANIVGSGNTRWVTGMRVLYNEARQVTRVTTPYRYRRSLLGKGAYGRILPFIQQESTFWTRDLCERVDLERLAALRYAGDYYLWTCFARDTEVTIVESLLGGFLVHPGQKSEARSAYWSEVARFCGPLRPLDYVVAALDGAVWLAPSSMKKRLNAKHLLRWSAQERRWA